MSSSVRRSVPCTAVSHVNAAQISANFVSRANVEPDAASGETKLVSVSDVYLFIFVYLR